jgi:REP element-mobilizing transposase RayT
LKYPTVRFAEEQRNVIGVGFEDAVREGNYQVLICCVGHDHAHLVTVRHERSVERIAGHLKSKASMALRQAGCHPLKEHQIGEVIPTPWSSGCWSVFINDEEHLRCAIDYVNRHPMKEGLPEQKWNFLTRV